MNGFKQVDVNLPYQNYKLRLTRVFKISALSMTMYVTISIYIILKLKKAQQQQFLEGLILKRMFIYPAAFIALIVKYACHGCWDKKKMRHVCKNEVFSPKIIFCCVIFHGQCSTSTTRYLKLD